LVYYNVMTNEGKFTAKIIYKADDIAPDKWDEVFPSIAESYNFFRTLDQTTADQFKNCYITIYDGPDLVCIAPCFIMDYPLETTVEGPLRKIIETIKKVFPRFLCLRVLICGASACEGRIGIKSHHVAAVMKKLIAVLFSLAHQEKTALIAFKDFPPTASSILSPLRNIGFHEIQGYPSAVLPIRFKSFDEYLSSLSRSTRKDLKRKFAKTADHTKIEMEIRNDLGEYLDYAYTLYINTLKKSEVRFEIMPKTFFRNISLNMPGETKYFLWKIDGKLAAFSLCLVKNRVLVDAYIGMDYAFAHKYHFYYLTFRDILVWCMENKITAYEAGALNYDPKKRLDFEFIPQYVYARHVNPAANIFFGWICNLIKPENYDPLLKSLKAHEKD